MTLATSSTTQRWYTYSPYPDCPKMKSLQDPVNGDWAQVSLKRWNGEKGKFQGPYPYTMEVSTGDLYGIKEDYGGANPQVVAAKAFGVGIGAFFYTPMMMIYNTLIIIKHVVEVALHALRQSATDFEAKGIVGAFTHFSMRILWELPRKIFDDLWHVSRCPLYGGGLVLASLFALISPFEGRKWIGQIEKEWHGGVSYRGDFRFHLKHLTNTQVVYLGLCMQKRGNIRDQTERGEKRFKFCTSGS